MSRTRPALTPVVWKPPAARANAQPRRLGPLQVIDLPGNGPEDVLIDAEGWILTGLEDGRILRVRPDGRRIETVADTGGRPLGLELFADGRLLVCDARRGLLRVDPKTGDIELLGESAAGRPLVFCNNAAIAGDGTVYFSDSSQRFGIDHWRAEILEHSGTGRLLKRSPDGATEVLLGGLEFANGVALAADETFVAVAETGAYRVARRWLKGPRAGQRDLLADNLPGFPDNISTGTDGLIWVTLASPRNPLLDFLAAKPPILRRMIWRLPEALQPAPERTVRAVAFDGEGRLVHDLVAEPDRFHMVTGVREHRGTVYFGSLQGRTLAWARL